jgi:F-type H+-transporting ATPase subunit epsilon
MSELNVEIVTPAGITFRGEVQSCTVPGADGLFQILKGHADLLANLKIGIIKFKQLEGEKLLATSGGFLEVMKNRISIVVESAEFAHEIDVDRAKTAEQRARERLAQKGEVDMIRAEFALARALNRLRVSSQI